MSNLLLTYFMLTVKLLDVFIIYYQVRIGMEEYKIIVFLCLECHKTVEQNLIMLFQQQKTKKNMTYTLNANMLLLFATISNFFSLLFGLFSFNLLVFPSKLKEIL